MKKKIFGLLMTVVIGVCSFTSFSSTNALADEAPAINQTVSPEGWYAQNLNASTKLTPEQYLELMDYGSFESVGGIGKDIEVLDEILDTQPKYLNSIIERLNKLYQQCKD